MITERNIEAFILTYNRKDMLKDSITGLLNQSAGNIKITVMDNGSTDGTENLVKEMQKGHENLFYHKREVNGLQIDNFADAVHIAEKDYLIMFHDDDILHPDYIKYALKAINKYPNTAIISTNYKEWTHPNNENWAKASARFDYCKDKQTFANYLYRMQRFAYPAAIYKTQNLKNCSFDREYYAQFGKMGDKPIVVNAMQENDGAVIFRSKKLLRYRVHPGQDTASAGPYYEEIIAFNRFFKPFMNKTLYSKFMYNLINYKQLKCAYVWGRDNTLSLNEFIQKAIDENAGCLWTKFCITPYIGGLFIETAHILRKIFKTNYKRVFF